MDKHPVVGIDLGGTQIRGAVIQDNQLLNVEKSLVPPGEPREVVLDAFFELVDRLVSPNIKAIGVGVPSVVDQEKGIVYDVQNIPSWKKIHLKELMEDRYALPVFINNDANCFALGEKYFGVGKDYKSFVGLAIGTGIGGGVVINGRLYSGRNCGAGEFGMVNYLDKNHEYYSSGQFFRYLKEKDGKEVFEKAKQGNKGALELYNEFGKHLGNTIQTILYTYDPELIIIGGSIKDAYTFFKKSMKEQIEKFAYTPTIENIQIKVSTLENGGIYGAGALALEGLSLL